MLTLRSLWYCGLTALVLSLPMAGAQGGEHFFVNLIEAESLNCSPDQFTGADLRIRLYVEGELVYSTHKASDQAREIFGDLLRVDEAWPTNLSVVVEEAEPVGIAGTDWQTCDLAAGPNSAADFHYASGETERFSFVGDGQDAARVMLTVGLDPPALPVVEVDAVGTDSVRVRIDAAPDQATRQDAAAGQAGPLLGSLPVSGGSLVVAGLCDDQDYHFRGVRALGSWRVSGPDIAVTTANLPPVEPRILDVLDPGEGETHTRIQAETRQVHDLSRIEVHAGPRADFTPDGASLRASADVVVAPLGAFSLSAILDANDTHLRVKTIERSGESAVSASFARDAPARGRLYEPDTCARSAAAAQTVGPASRESAATGAPPLASAVSRTAPGGFDEVETTPLPAGLAVVALIGAATAWRTRRR